ncbi:MAG TPA: ABC transporter permease [Jatrophihabitantaceae bacterium]|jgi:putative ABC transport system permease protein
MFWLVRPTLRGAPQRLLLAAVAVALPVAILAATLLYVDSALRSMTRVALRPVQVEMRALAASLDTDMRQVARRLSAVPEVKRIDLFGSADVVVSAGSARIPARLYAVDESYLAHHPWVHTSGDLRRGALLTEPLAAAIGPASTVSIGAAERAAPTDLALPVAGRADLRDASTWFAIPTGDVQGDLAVKPRAIVIDYATFERTVLPALRRSLGSSTNVTNPGLSDLPPASNEAHVTVDHGTYPADPAAAATWSANLRRTLERASPGDVIVADNAGEPLSEAATDATNAKILFILLGVPGALVAAALGLTAAAALAEANRREDALLRLRGATDRQLVRLAVGQGVIAGIAGTGLGLLAAAAGVSAVVGHAAWRDIPPGRLAQTAVLATAMGALTIAARLVPMARANRRSGIVTERRRLDTRRAPFWLRTRLDIMLLALGGAILAGNILIGGLQPTPVEGQTVALSFYVLLAPLAIWAGATLLLVRGLLAVLVRHSRPERSSPLTTWRATMLRWLGRRPVRTAGTVVLGALAVAFGTEVVTFVATYTHAEQTDARAAFGADLRLTPLDENAPPPAVGANVAAVTPIRTIPGRAGPDRKNVLAIDPRSYVATAIPPRIVRGGGVAALAAQRNGVLIADEVARGFRIGPGDTLPVTVFPDEPGASRQLDLRVVGVYRAFAPTDPLAEMVVTTTTVPGALPAPDFYLARVAKDRTPDDVAAGLRESAAAGSVSVTTISDNIRQEQRGLTSVDLDGLSRIEAVGAGLVAAIGVGVLGAFLVIERRRELAVLRVIGADSRHVLAGPVLEGTVASIGSIVIGVPVGIGLSIIAIRVLDLFFALPPPLVVVPWANVVVLAACVVAASAVALGIALLGIRRRSVAAILREP